MEDNNTADYEYSFIKNPPTKKPSKAEIDKRKEGQYNSNKSARWDKSQKKFIDKNDYEAPNKNKGKSKAEQAMIDKRKEGQYNSDKSARWDKSKQKFIDKNDYEAPNKNKGKSKAEQAMIENRTQGQRNEKGTAVWNEKLGKFIPNYMKVLPDGTLTKRQEGELNKDGTSVWTYDKDGKGTNGWKKLDGGGSGSGGGGGSSNFKYTGGIGELSKDGYKVNMGNGKWETVSFTLDGREYENPLTGKLVTIPGVISLDKKTVFNGTTWEPVKLSSDGKKYLNPVTNKYAPVELVRTDKFGRDWQWNLFDDSWMGFANE